jgi:hypothetical protein
MAGLLLASDGHEVALHARNEARAEPAQHAASTRRGIRRCLHHRGDAFAHRAGERARRACSATRTFRIMASSALRGCAYMLKNVAAIREAAGTALENVVRRACFHDTGERFAQSMDEWVARFPERKPCSTTLIIGGPLVVPGAHTLLDLIAYVPD